MFRMVQLKGVQDKEVWWAGRPGEELEGFFELAGNQVELGGSSANGQESITHMQHHVASVQNLLISISLMESPCR